MVDERAFERLISEKTSSPFTFDNCCNESQGIQPSDQLSLINVFWCTTLFCIILGLYRFVGPLFSLGLVIAVIVYLVQQVIPCSYGVTGGLLAFVTSLVCLPIVVAWGGLSTLNEILLSMMMPCVAFVYGAFLAEWRQMR